MTKGLALAVLAAVSLLNAAPSFAAAAHSHAGATHGVATCGVQMHPMSLAACAAEGNPDGFASHFIPPHSPLYDDPANVIVGGVYVGRDPDPNVRLEIRRDATQGVQ